MAKRNSIFFEKKEDALPFFSIHPSTMVGRILRIVLVAFFLITAVLILLANAGLTFIKFYDLYYLLYIVPAVIVMALIVLALYKRMNTLISKILVCGSIGFLVVSIIMTMASMLSMTSAYAWHAAMGLKVEGAGNIIMMRTCVYPDEIAMVDSEDGNSGHFAYHIPSYKYTAAPADGIGKSEGEILVASSSKFNVEVEWISPDKCRYYLSADSEGHGSGEIIVTFDGKSEAKASETALFRSNSTNGSNTVNLYREDSYIEASTNTIYNLTEECFERIYRAYPTSLYYFVKTNTRVEDAIKVEPFGNLDALAVDASQLDDGILTIYPADSCVGASGKVTIYLNEKASTSDSNGTESEADASKA